jgi:hypothetical protein
MNVALSFGTTPPNTTVTAQLTAGNTLVPINSASNLQIGQILNLNGNGSATGTVNKTLATAALTGATTLSLNNVTGVGPNQVVSGTGIAAGTTVVSTQIVNGTDNQVTLSAGITADLAVGATITFGSPAGTFLAGSTVSIANIITTSGVGGCVTAPCLVLSAAPLLSVTNASLVFAGATVQQVCPMIPFAHYGGASTDPNNGSLWLYGEFAKNRLSTIPGPGQWGTSVANYALDFPATDPYNNDNAFYADVPASNPYFTWIQIAKNQGITQNAPTSGPCPATPPGNPPILQPPGSGSTPTPGTSTLICPNFGPTALVTRSEMARWVVLAQMDEVQITAYLLATGGDVGDPHHVTFADTISDPNLRYIEVMARRGYTKGCGTTNDGRAAYCPTNNVTRGEMSVFIIRAKMSNVFPTSLSGAPVPVLSPYGDNFGVFQQASYFTDVPATHVFYPYIQKMRELRITNGAGTASTYLPDSNITRQEIATFIVRAFFL